MAFLATLKGLVSGGAQVARVVDKFVSTKGERLELEKEDADAVRGMLDSYIHGTWFDALVDGINRLVRPGITIYLCVGFDGRLIQLPDPTQVDPFWQTCFYLVLTFWFGGRMIMKDLPQAIMYFSKMRKKLK